MVQAKNERSMADLDYVQNGLPRFHTHNEISQPPQEKMTNLEATMAEWRRFQAEFETSQSNFMEKMNKPPQERLIFENEVDELAISMAELAKSQAKLVTSQEEFLEETKAQVQFQSIPLKSSKGTMIPRAMFSYSIRIEDRTTSKYEGNEYRKVNGPTHEEGTTKEFP